MTLLEFTYLASWYPSTDAGGFSLEIEDDTVPVADWNLAANWQPSSAINGSPGSANGSEPLFEFIELRNIGADTLDLASISFTAGIVFESSTLLLETSLRANAHSLSVIPQPSLFATDRAFLSLARIQAASRIAQKPLPLPTQEL